MKIQHNVTAMNSHRMYTINASNMAKNVEKLSSGYKINRAGDDAAGLAISEKMRGQIRGLSMASKNSQDAVSLIQTAEGALQSTQDILQRMRELAVQSASDTNQDTVDREAMDLEFQALIKEIDSISSTTEFNNMKLVDGSFGAGGGAKIASTSAVNIGLNGLAGLSLTGKWATNDAIAISNTGVITLTGTFAAANGYTVSNLGLTTSGAGSYSFSVMNSSGSVVATGKITTGAGFNVANAIGTITLQGAGTTSKVIQVGANSGQELDISIANMDSNSIGDYGGNLFDDYGANTVTSGKALSDQKITTQDDASTAIEIVNSANNMVSMQRAALGALQNRLEFKISNLDTSAENLQAAESRIRDTDMAKEMTAFVKNNILFQASTAMLAQANSLPQGVLQLLG